MSTLHDAAENNAPAELTRLLQAGADINATVGEGETALTLTVQEGHAGCVRLLRAAGTHE